MRRFRSKISEDRFIYKAHKVSVGKDIHDFILVPGIFDWSSYVLYCYTETYTYSTPTRTYYYVCLRNLLSESENRYTHTESVKSVCFTGKHILGGCEGGRIAVISFPQMRSVNNIRLFEDGRITKILSYRNEKNGNSKFMCICELKTGYGLMTIENYESPQLKIKKIYAIDKRIKEFFFLKNDPSIAFFLIDYEIVKFDVEQEKVIRTFDFQKIVQSTSYYPRNLCSYVDSESTEHLLVGSHDSNSTYLYIIDHNREDLLLKEPKGYRRIFSPSGNLYSLTCHNDFIYICTPRNYIAYDIERAKEYRIRIEEKKRSTYGKDITCPESKLVGFGRRGLFKIEKQRWEVFDLDKFIDYMKRYPKTDSGEHFRHYQYALRRIELNEQNNKQRNLEILQRIEHHLVEHNGSSQRKEDKRSAGKPKKKEEESIDDFRKLCLEQKKLIEKLKGRIEAQKLQIIEQNEVIKKLQDRSEISKIRYEIRDMKKLLLDVISKSKQSKDVILEKSAERNMHVGKFNVSEVQFDPDLPFDLIKKSFTCFCSDEKMYDLQILFTTTTNDTQQQQKEEEEEEIEGEGECCDLRLSINGSILKPSSVLPTSLIYRLKFDEVGIRKFSFKNLEYEFYVNVEDSKICLEKSQIVLSDATSIKSKKKKNQDELLEFQRGSEVLIEMNLKNKDGFDIPLDIVKLENEMDEVSVKFVKRKKKVKSMIVDLESYKDGKIEIGKFLLDDDDEKSKFVVDNDRYQIVVYSENFILKKEFKVVSS